MPITGVLRQFAFRWVKVEECAEDRFAVMGKENALKGRNFIASLK